MKIILLNKHEAIAAATAQPGRVEVSPAISGTLVVNGVSYPVTDGVGEAAIADCPRAKAVFIKEGGVKYDIVAPRIHHGELTTRLDPYDEVIRLRIELDRLEKELEQTRTELAAFKGRWEHNSLAGIID